MNRPQDPSPTQHVKKGDSSKSLQEQPRNMNPLSSQALRRRITLSPTTITCQWTASNSRRTLHADSTRSQHKQNHLKSSERLNNSGMFDLHRSRQAAFPWRPPLGMLSVSVPPVHCAVTTDLAPHVSIILVETLEGRAVISQSGLAISRRRG